jgi:hypothetical protein
MVPNAAVEDEDEDIKNFKELLAKMKAKDQEIANEN